MSENKSASTRRDFLKTGTTAAAEAVVATSIGRVAHAKGSDTIKIGMIGAGGRCTGAAGQAMNTSGGTKLVAMCDAFRYRLDGSYNSLKKRYKDKVDVSESGKFVGLDSYKKVLETDCDLIVTATPPHFRSIHVLAAIKAGKNVFAEKPVAVDAPGVRRFLEATELAKEKGLALAVGLQRHHEAQYIDTIKRLQDGAIGDINFMRAYWDGGGVWTRDRKSLAQKLGRKPTEMEYQVNNWYYFNWLCGDHIVEQHIHNLDVINWLKGATWRGDRAPRGAGRAATSAPPLGAM